MAAAILTVLESSTPSQLPNRHAGRSCPVLKQASSPSSTTNSALDISGSSSPLSMNGSVASFCCAPPTQCSPYMDILDDKVSFSDENELSSNVAFERNSSGISTPTFAAPGHPGVAQLQLAAPPVTTISMNGNSNRSSSNSRSNSNSGDSTFVVTLSELGSTLQQQLNTIEGVHAVFGSSLLRMATEPDFLDRRVITAVAGTGLAPWEIHRPQKFVRDLILRRCFSGRVLDAGCGIGDNALFVAKAAAPGTKVVAVDVVPRCLSFASTKAGLRGMRGKVELVVADLRYYDTLPPELQSQPFNIVLDSSTFHGFADEERDLYAATLARLLCPGGLLYMSCMSEEEIRPGGPRRLTIEEVCRVFCCTGSSDGGGGGSRSTEEVCTASPAREPRRRDQQIATDEGVAADSRSSTPRWRLEAVEDTVTELHPTFWGGVAKARLYTLRRL